MPSRPIRIATRKSPLAIWQAEYIRASLLEHWPNLDIELVPLVTSGDKFLQSQLTPVGGKGLFVKELEDALFAGQADLAVHSMKDVPVILPPGLSIAAISQRHAPWDALLSIQYACLADLPEGATIGTVSLRRQSQLLAKRRDLTIKPLRGNVGSRIKKLTEGEFNAIVLAVAGLERLGLQQHIRQVLRDDVLLPACGQGAIGIECRTADSATLTLLAPLNDAPSALCVNTERLVNAALGGNCHTPLAIFCDMPSSQQIRIRACLALPDGSHIIRHTAEGPSTQADSLANECIQALIDKGAKSIMNLNCLS